MHRNENFSVYCAIAFTTWAFLSCLGALIKFIFGV